MNNTRQIKTFIGAMMLAGVTAAGYAGFASHTLHPFFALAVLALAAATSRMKVKLPGINGNMSMNLPFLLTAVVTRHEVTSPRKLFGVIAGMAGILLIVGVDAFHDVGGGLVAEAAIVAATICYACAAIFGRSFKGLDPLAPAAGSLLAGAAVLIPASLVLEQPWTLSPSLSSVLALLALAVFSTAAAFAIYFRLIQTLGSVGTTAQAYLRVPIGVAISVAFLGETLSQTAWIGLACVVLGVAAMTIPARRPAVAKPS